MILNGMESEQEITRRKTRFSKVVSVYFPGKKWEFGFNLLNVKIEFRALFDLNGKIN